MSGKYTVFFHDVKDVTLNEMIDYCHDAPLSLVKYTNDDISDLSLVHDTLQSFTFTKKHDALIFKLKFKP